MYAEAARFYDLIHDARGRDAKAEAALVLGEVRHRNPNAKTLLDVGCGTGAHLPAFADALGADNVEGVDLSADMLAIAAERAPGIRLTSADMRELDLGGRTFDSVVCLFSAIGYLTELDDLHRAIAEMARHLAPGGVLLVEGWIEPDHWLGATVHAESARGDGVAIARVVRSARDGVRTELFMRYDLATPHAITSHDEHHVMRLSVPAELEDAYTSAGLTFERLPHMLRPARAVYAGVRAATR